MREITYKIKDVELQDNKHYLTKGKLYLSEGMVFECVSGGYGRGTIPLGKYVVEAPIEIENTEQYKAYRRDGFPWISKLTPIGKCEDAEGDRTGLLIHPDGNLPNTLGCIGIIENDIACYGILSSLFEENQSLLLKVV